MVIEVNNGRFKMAAESLERLKPHSLNRTGALLDINHEPDELKRQFGTYLLMKNDGLSHHR